MGDPGRRRKTKVTGHLYNGDGVPDQRGNDRCVHCALAKAHGCHELPDTSAEQREHYRRAGGGQ